MDDGTRKLCMSNSYYRSKKTVGIIFKHPWLKLIAIVDQLGEGIHREPITSEV